MRIGGSDSFSKNVIKLASGTLISQLVALLAAPIITRLYGAENFGTVVIFSSISAVFIPIAGLRYELSIVLPPKKTEAANLFVLSIIIVLFFSILVFLTILFFGNKLFNLLDINQLLDFKWLIPLVILIVGVTASCNYWCTRHKYFSQISLSQIITQIFVTICGVSFGFFGFNTAITLIIVAIVGQLINLIVLVTKMINVNDVKYIITTVKSHKLIDGAIRYINFPKYSSVGALLNAASWQSPIILLAFFFPVSIVGFYGLGFRLIQMPMSLFGNAINQVFLQHGTSKNHEGNLSSGVEKLFILLFNLGLMPSLILMIVGADLFEFIFGLEWREAGIYVQILSPWAFLWFLSSPLSPVYSIKEQQKKELKMHSVIFFIRVISLLIGGYFGNARVSIFLFSLGGVVAYGYLLLQVFRMAELDPKDIFKKIYVELFKDLMLLLPLIFFIIFFNNIILSTSASLILLIIVAIQKHRKLKFQKYV
jgi:lipopolysaccharide exporter